ncbi:MAG: PEP-CTERM sorting domain-containing protein [candidate division Zixibacteria bacterium]|nr:PEP-CTERM sorting domain-containing protein [candidate division Zixibacteria bacterium]
MKKILTLGFLIGFVFICSVSSFGAVFTFDPNPADIYDLDHYYAYTWGINWNSSDYPITSAYLTFTNIQNWTSDPNDILYMNLLDNADVGVHAIYEKNTAGNYFADKGGTLFDTWTDLDDNATSENLTISLNDYISDLNTFASDGLFGIGFDPDCHYWNDGVKLTINANVPEPTTVLLFGLGALGMAAYRRRR